MPASEQTHRTLVVVSHPAVLPTNQLPYAALAGRGWRVVLITPVQWRHAYAPDPFAAEPLPELARNFVGRRVLFAGAPQRHIYMVNPYAELRRHYPDILFCEQEPFSIAAAQWGFAAWALRVPFGVQMDENLDRPLPGLARAIRSIVLSRAAFVAARSASATRLAHKWGARGRVGLVPHHVPPWPLPGRQKQSAFTVGFAGRLVAEKGLDTLAAAVSQLEPPVEVVVAGDGPLRGWLKSADLGAARLRMLPRTGPDEMPSVYAQMDVLVLPSVTTPSWAEQFGRVLVEALWCGTPVIGSDSGEIPWVISNTGGGLIFPEGDASALATRLTQLRDDPDLRDELARSGRSRVVEMFTPEAAADRLEELLSVALQEQRP